MTDDKKKPNRELKPWRKVVYIIGNILMVVGFILFFMGIFGFMAPKFEFGPDFDGRRFVFGFMARPFIGFACIFLGSFLRSLGRGGLAGAGVILDPEKERRDAEPFSRSQGGKYADTYDEFKSESGFNEDLERIRVAPKERIMVRCPNCKTLNDEDAQFCKSCGQQLH